MSAYSIVFLFTPVPPCQRFFSGTKKAAGEPFLRFFRRLQAACHWLGYDKGRIWQLAMNLVIP